MNRKILFISRNYPPKTGGLETYSYNLVKEFEKDGSVHKIVLGRSNLNLFWFLPFSFFKALLVARNNALSNIHLCDGVLAPVGILLKCLTRHPVSVSIHGLDITYRNRFYQRLIPRCVASLDKIICVSRSTKDECVRRGIPEQKCVVIPNGIRPDDLYFHLTPAELRRKLEKLLDMRLPGKKILLTVGRMIKRKGVAWFVDCVMPELDDTYLYLIAGHGPEFESINRKVEERCLQGRVRMLGRVSENVRRLIYSAADIFIMPNITVEGDVEGFGIAAIEAGSYGLPVVASNLQGLKDAIIDKETGYLVEERNTREFLDRIRSMDLRKKDIRRLVNTRFHWSEIYKQYQTALRQL